MTQPKELQALLAIFNSKVNLKPQDQQLLLNSWNKEIILKRHDYLIELNKVEQSLYFVCSGTLRIFYPHETDEVCVGFGYDHTLLCSYPSFIKGQPSEYYIQALQPCRLLGISRKDFYTLINQIPALERAWRLLTEEALLGKIEREVEMLSFTPEQRLKRLQERSPHLFRNFPRKYIASYLRMKPETLSRIKN